MYTQNNHNVPAFPAPLLLHIFKCSEHLWRIRNFKLTFPDTFLLLDGLLRVENILIFMCIFSIFSST